MWGLGLQVIGSMPLWRVDMNSHPAASMPCTSVNPSTPVVLLQVGSVNGLIRSTLRTQAPRACGGNGFCPGKPWRLCPKPLRLTSMSPNPTQAVSSRFPRPLPKGRLKPRSSTSSLASWLLACWAPMSSNTRMVGVACTALLCYLLPIVALILALLGRLLVLFFFSTVAKPERIFPRDLHRQPLPGHPTRPGLG